MWRIARHPPWDPISLIMLPGLCDTRRSSYRAASQLRTLIETYLTTYSLQVKLWGDEISLENCDRMNYAHEALSCYSGIE